MPPRVDYACLAVGRGEVGLEQHGRALALLSPAERREVAALGAGATAPALALARAHGHALSRALCRLMVAAAAGHAPAEVALTRGPQGLAATTGRVAWAVSISHGVDHVACAVGHAAGGARVGVDVEAARRFAGRSPQPLRLARRFFDPAEAEAVATVLGEQLQAEAFLAAWTVKEAVAKALGTGLRPGPAHFRLDVSALCAAARDAAGPWSQQHGASPWWVPVTRWVAAPIHAAVLRPRPGKSEAQAMLALARLATSGPRASAGALSPTHRDRVAFVAVAAAAAAALACGPERV